MMNLSKWLSGDMYKFIPLLLGNASDHVHDWTIFVYEWVNWNVVVFFVGLLIIEYWAGNLILFFMLGYNDCEFSLNIALRFEDDESKLRTISLIFPWCNEDPHDGDILFLPYWSYLIDPAKYVLSFILNANNGSQSRLELLTHEPWIVNVTPAGQISSRRLNQY